MRVIRAISWVLTFVAVGAAAAAWFTPRVTADRAADVAIDALEEAGIDDATVKGTPRTGVFTPSPATDEATTDDAKTDGAETDGGTATSTTSKGTPDGSSTTATADGEAATGDDADEVDVWRVQVSSADEVIEMWVHKTEGQLVYVDDAIGENQDQRLLSDAEWEDVRAFDSGGVDPWISRNVAAAAAAVGIVGVGFVLARRTGDLGRRPA